MAVRLSGAGGPAMPNDLFRRMRLPHCEWPDDIDKCDKHFSGFFLVDHMGRVFEPDEVLFRRLDAVEPSVRER